MSSFLTYMHHFINYVLQLRRHARHLESEALVPNKTKQNKNRLCGDFVSYISCTPINGPVLILCKPWIIFPV